MINGKTGTAQTANPVQPTNAWFIAFAPVENPTIALAVLVENGGGGSSVAGPVARAVLDAYMQKTKSAAQQEMVVQRQAI